jgi:putative flippase GtrA
VATIHQAGRTIIARQEFRYLLVGAANTAVGYGLFSICLLLLAFPYPIALVVSHIVSVSVAFVLYRTFVFDSEGNAWLDFFRCHMVYLGQLAVSAVLLAALVELAGLHPMVALLFTLVTTVIVSFFGHKYVSFRR